MAVNCMKKAKPKPESAGPRPLVGHPFNPSYKVCGFHPPEIVRRCKNLKQGPKLLYQCAVHWAGDKGAFWYGFDSLARELGYSIRQAKRDMRTLEGSGLISHVRRGNGRTNRYQFLWHKMFEAEVSNTAHQTGTDEVPVTAHQTDTDPEDEAGPEVPYTARLEVSNRVSRCAVNGTQILQGIQQEGTLQGEADIQADYRLASPKTGEGLRNAGLSDAHEKQNEKPSPDLGALPEVGAKEQNQNHPVNENPTEWTPLQIEVLAKGWLEPMMPGAGPVPQNLVDFIVLTAIERSALPVDVHKALLPAFTRAGKKNGPRDWNWFYPIVRNAFIPGHAARVPEATAAPQPAHQASTEGLRGIEALELADAPDSLVASYPCKCGGEIRQYQNRVVGTCVCAPAQTAEAELAQMPIRSQQRLAEPLRRRV